MIRLHLALIAALAVAAPFAWAGVDTTDTGQTLEEWQSLICGPQVGDVWADPGPLGRSYSGSVLDVDRLSPGGWLVVPPWPGYAVKDRPVQPVAPVPPSMPPVPLPASVWFAMAGLGILAMIATHKSKQKGKI